ncbi:MULTISPECIES: hypothetical protein [Sphingobacterium]|jgi:hypothetical protein|uniref:hypothetical protein n=1 Tax=Sphingobacterium TaxID=28453 RepID=UPI001586C238|nr:MULTISPECIES: hypothetical protein [Sphingobacterium]QQT62967.1 hypothetical protein I6I97_03910 [Sphingobacterium multivorum]
MNTLDLKGFGVQEMDAKEMEVIDGGWWQAALGTFLYNVVADWRQNVAAFERGINGEAL